MTSVDDIKKAYSLFVAQDEFHRPFLRWEDVSASQDQSPVLVEVFITSHFASQVSSRRKELRKDPLQLYKALRNTRRGYHPKTGQSGGGRDGVFDVDCRRYDNDMTRQLVKVTNNQQTMASLRHKYPFLNSNARLVRVVAHPNNVRIRPVGLLSISSGALGQQRLLLVALAIFGLE